jgi:hypothetical protein
MDNLLIYEGKICPYCNSKTEYVDSSCIYGKSYGMIYICKPCDAYVGVHKGTDKALGRLANKDLRHWKKEAHAHFDPIWKKEVEKGIDKKGARNKAYKWLSEQMELHIDLTHIGMMDIKQCKQVVKFCNELIKNHDI